MNDAGTPTGYVAHPMIPPGPVRSQAASRSCPALPYQIMTPTSLGQIDDNERESESTNDNASGRSIGASLYARCTSFWYRSKR